MNIFVLSQKPSEAAIAHCDVHLHKMLLETAQMLSTALHELNPAKWNQMHSLGHTYKPTHANHPCNVWLRKSINNIEWLSNLGIALAIERRYRGFYTTHKSFDIVLRNRDALFNSFNNIENHTYNEQPTPFVFCGSDYISYQQWDVVTKYQALYRDKYANGMRMYW